MIPTHSPAELAKPIRTPAYEHGFGPNTDKLLHLLSFRSKGLAGYSLDTQKIVAKIASLAPDDPHGLVAGAKEAVQALTKHTTELTGGIQAIHSLVPVLTVTTVEAYLKDVLIYAAGIDKRLMERSEQATSYQDVCVAESLATVINELRGKWAQNFIDRRRS